MQLFSQQVWLHCILFWLLFGHISSGMVLARSILPASDLRISFVLRLGCAFILSMLLNSVYLFIILGFGISPFAIAGLALLIDVAALLYVFAGRQSEWKVPWGREAGIVGLLALLAFCVSIRSGGLLDIVADSWWHLGQAYDLTLVMATGGSTVGSLIFTGDLWTGLLAWASILSGATLPEVWDAMTSWVAVITVAAYYFLARALCFSIAAAAVAVLLFLILVGGLNSGFRLFAWPAGLSYAAWYFLAAVFLGFLANVHKKTSGGTVGIACLIRHSISIHRPEIMLMLVTVLFVWLQHEAELFLFGMSILFYFIFLCFSSVSELRSDRLLLIVPCSLVLLAVFTMSFRSTDVVASAIWVATGIVGGVLALGRVRQWAIGAERRILAALTLIILAGVVLWMIDWPHVLELFVPESRSGTYYDVYIPHWFKGMFGEWVRLPQWEHQLRDGLLWSALVSVLVAAWLYLSRPSRGYAFLLANAAVPLLVLVSPYLFTILTAVIPEEGIYRIHMLIFHPIILSAGLFTAISIIGEQSAPSQAASR